MSSKRARRNPPDSDAAAAEGAEEEEEEVYEEEQPGEYEELLADNESLVHERTQLLATFLRLTHALEEVESRHDPSLIKEHQQLSAELDAHRMLVEAFREMTGDEQTGGGGSRLAAAEAALAAVAATSSSGEEDGGGTTWQPKLDSLNHDLPKFGVQPNTALLEQLAQEAEMKLISLVSASQDPRNKWVRAVFPDLGNLPSFFRDLIFHYQCGRDFIGKVEADGTVNMRFDVMFPGFSPSVVSEITWRLFSSEEHSRRIMRDGNLKLNVVDDKVDPTTGQRIRVLRMQNSLKRPNLHRTVSTTMVCLKTRRTLAKSTLHPPLKNKSGIPQHGGLVYPSTSAGGGVVEDLSASRYGNVDCHFTSNSSTLLFPMEELDEQDERQAAAAVADARAADVAAGREPSPPPVVVAQKLQGNLIQGSIAWSEGDGARLVVLVSFPRDYIHEGETAEKRFEADASVKGSAVTVSKWLTKLVEHATSQFVSYVLEETLHRRGRDVTTTTTSGGAASSCGGEGNAVNAIAAATTAAKATTVSSSSAAAPSSTGEEAAAETIRVATVSPAASSFLKSLVRPARKGNTPTSNHNA